jgi:two-component system, NtrC family, sensor kinase
MRRRRGTASTGTRSRKPLANKGHRTPASGRRSGHQSTHAFKQLKRALDEARQQQTAAADVLKVISGSAFDLKLVLETLIKSATRLCGATRGHILQFNGEFLIFAAAHGAFPGFTEFLAARPFRPGPGTVAGRAARDRRTVHVHDVLKEPGYEHTDLVKRQGYRTVLAVPMLRGDIPLGVIAILKPEVEPFTKKQIELVETFADQAVIAIENTRLLNELRERTDDLSGALERQTATSELLQIVSSSPGELEPVFAAMLQNAVRICGAKFGLLWIREGDANAFRIVATHRAPRAYVDFVHNRVFHPDPRTGLGALIRTREVYQFADLASAPMYGDNLRQATVDLAGAQTLIGVPMLKDNEVIGAISIYHQEVRPFTDKQIELVKNFASQAVIAIENTRLLRELRESLEQQTATSDVLKVISSSQGELQPVFDAMLASATQICGAEFGLLYRSEGDEFRTVALYGVPPRFADERRLKPMLRPSPGTALGRVVTEGQHVQIADVMAEPAYQNDPLRRASFLDLAGARTVLCVPMLKEGAVVGAISIYRQEVLPFTDKQVELLKNFGAQAVIAIENTRLLNELRESLQQQTATADVLKVISRSTFDLQIVLQTLVESASRLCDADKGNITREKNGVFYRAAESYGFTREFLDHIKGVPLTPDRGNATGRALLESRVIHIPDVKADPEYTLVDAQRLGDYRTVLAVPMLREGVALGVLTLSRSEARPFTDKQIELVTTFADQAAIAIENVRLFESVEARTRELAKSLDDLRTTQDRLVQTQKLALLGQLTAGIAHEIKNPLNFVNNFSGISVELIDELQGTLKAIPLDDKARTDINELTGTLKSNFDKVVHHGRRADAIVKNMLQHSREGSGEHRVIDINTLVEESLNLAWHGARAETQGFEIKVGQAFDTAAGQADVFPQDIRRALLNMISNGFYAATRRRAETNGGDYEPTLTASTKNLGDRVEIRIRDNGTGMTPDVKEKMFNPFFTTKPTGEGTGLGLSISHDIIVKQHGGSIEVDTQPGEFTEIRVILPRVAAPV